ncbi:uncharacterized protein si:dkey-225f5.4 [Nematolebias whitei]|uniref:uncharacterized protein si:dkey-225f5.4 n=1 Tax=Nematolebias whitei TaxID=451745 RepID=UPI001899E675|nr:uncharacterized protein si:dkey-225f5.4 [Nematolebias whitei]
MAEIRAVLQRCDPCLLDPDPECSEETAGTLLFLTDSRSVQKVFCRQLFVLDSMMSLLEGLDTSQQLMTQPCPPLPEGGARSRWKALKVKNRLGVEETEALLRTLQDRVQQIHDRRRKLTQLVQQLHSKVQQREELEVSLLKAQNALCSCDQQLKQLGAESETELGQLTVWQQLRNELQAHAAASQDVMQINLLAFSQSELRVDLRPRPCSILSSNELEPLRLLVTWSSEDRFGLQVEAGPVGLVEGCVLGRWTELSTALLRILQCFVGQAELLSEIQNLRTSFAIDWHPAQRLLVYLKSASLVCHLEVEEGYPGCGRARLKSVRRDGQPVDTSGLKPRKEDLSLTEWLVFLCSAALL